MVIHPPQRTTEKQLLYYKGMLRLNVRYAINHSTTSKMFPITEENQMNTLYIL